MRSHDNVSRAYSIPLGREKSDLGGAAGLMAGYLAEIDLLPAERAALPRLAAGAALRFTLTRAFDWLNTPAGALVTRKDPMAFARRLTWYLDSTPEMMLGQ